MDMEFVFYHDASVCEIVNPRLDTTPYPLAILLAKIFLPSSAFFSLLLTEWAKSNASANATPHHCLTPTLLAGSLGENGAGTMVVWSGCTLLEGFSFLILFSSR